MTANEETPRVSTTPISTVTRILHDPTTNSSRNNDNNITLPTHHVHNRAHHHARSGTGFHSEHGHHLSSIAPMAVHSGSSVATFFNGLFQTILAISTLGASITFNFVLSNGPDSNSLDDPSQQPSRGGPGPHFSAATVQQFLSVSWLLFLLALASASTGSTLLTFFRRHWEEDWDGNHGRVSQTTVHWYAIATSALLGALLVGAFSLLCLVVVAYSRVVGLIALAFTGFFGSIIFFGIAMQTPVPWAEKNGRENDAGEKEGRVATA